MQGACEHWLKLMDMNASSKEEAEFTDNLTDAIHEVCDYLRDEMEKVINNNKENETKSLLAPMTSTCCFFLVKNHPNKPPLPAVANIINISFMLYNIRC